jgi:transposase
MVPHHCCNRFVRWRQAGIWHRIMDVLAAGHDAKSAQPTTADGSQGTSM